MKIATWNVNSLRVRLPQVLQWLQHHQPDVLALQEIKMPDEKFPHEAVRELGYQAIVYGQKTYNGVATLSRLPIQQHSRGLPNLMDLQSRVLRVDCANKVIINVYVPNGEAVGSEKFFYKLQWLTALRQYLQQLLTENKNIIVLGDFNIAPTDEDVRHPEQWHEKILCSSSERQAFQELLQLGLVDSFRLFAQPPKMYSWWDYRSLAFRRNAGLRIDHILLSSSLISVCQQCEIDKAPRGWVQPSDHAPVMVKLTS